jgi:hypothetical protein
MTWWLDGFFENSLPFPGFRQLCILCWRWQLGMLHRLFFRRISSLTNGCAGFAFYLNEILGYKISSPSSIFTAEFTALFVTLQHIREVIQLQDFDWFWLTAWVQLRLCCPGKYCIELIRWFTNVKRCVATYWRMELRWGLPKISLPESRWMVLFFERPFSPVDFQGLARSVLLREWQDVRRYKHW